MRTLGLLAVLALAAGCSGKDTAETGAPPTTTTPPTTTAHPALALTGDSMAGETVFANNCSGCHAADATGNIGPDLTAAAPTLSDEDIVLTIADGSGNMNPIAISDQEIADVLAWLRASFG